MQAKSRSGLEGRVAKVEGILEEMHARLKHLETRFNWMLGIMITMWVTVILTILFKG